MISIFKKIKIERSETKWVTITETKYVLRYWVRFLRWLFKDQYTDLMEHCRWYDDKRLSNHLKQLAERAMPGKELIMQRKLWELGYEVKSQIAAAVVYDGDDFITGIEPQLVDRSKPMYTVEKRTEEKTDE